MWLGQSHRGVPFISFPYWGRYRQKDKRQLRIQTPLKISWNWPPLYPLLEWRFPVKYDRWNLRVPTCVSTVPRNTGRKDFCWVGDESEQLRRGQVMTKLGRLCWRGADHACCLALPSPSPDTLACFVATPGTPNCRSAFHLLIFFFC